MRDEPTFAGWLRQARREADLTQEALAEAVGCAAQTLRAFESGRRRPSREMAFRLAQVLHVPVSDCDAFVRLARTTPAAEASLSHGSGALPPLEARVTSSRHATMLVNFQPPVLATKLYRPSSDTSLVRRERLFERLDGALSRPLTLVAAPAGSGKTTLIGNWLATRQQASGQPLSVAWLTLDADDSDPVRFLRYLIAALQTVAPSAGAVTLSLLDLPHVAPITTLITV